MPDPTTKISALPEDQEKIPGDGPGAEYVSPKGIAILAVLLSALSLSLLGALYAAWPRCEAAACAGEKGRSASGTRQVADAPAQARPPVTAPAAPPPAVSPRPVEIRSIRPTAGPSSGGTRVTLLGSGFAPQAQVTFNGLAAEDVSIAADGTALYATSPCHPSGASDVAVTNPDGGKDSLPGAFQYTCACDSESKILFLVLLAGALGGILHSLRSLFWYVGNRKLIRSWTLKYFILPLNGALLACVFYLIIRTGLFDPEESTNCIAVVGIGVLVGMFSEEAIEKLRMIAAAVLTSKPQGADRAPSPLPGTATTSTGPQISVNPASGKAEGGEPVTILGEGFSGLPTVTFGGQPVKPENITVLSPKVLRVITPPAPELGEVEVVVTVPGGTPMKNPKGFVYTQT